MLSVSEYVLYIYCVFYIKIAGSYANRGWANMITAGFWGCTRAWDLSLPALIINCEWKDSLHPCWHGGYFHSKMHRHLLFLTYTQAIGLSIMPYQLDLIDTAASLKHL